MSMQKKLPSTVARKKNFRFFCMIFGLMFLGMAISPENAQAGYLDPGSGSTLVQVIIAAVAGVKTFWNATFGRVIRLITGK